MQLNHLKSAVVGAWVLGLAAVALSFEVTSASGWMFLVGLGLLPPLVLLRMWRQPGQTMSESIHEVLR
jgi:hypothetical protein